ncbi:MAG: MBL fold metallo-hydrolase [Oscillospiraceae bacterium]
MDKNSIQLFEIGSYMLRNYILKTPAGYIAIDTGYPGQLDTFLKRFAKIAPLQELKYIFLTHSHDDHAGFLKGLLSKCDAKVILNPSGIDDLQKGQNPILPGAGYATRMGALFGVFKKDFSFPSVHLLPQQMIAVTTEEEQFFHTLGLPLTILLLPGHTRDSIGLLWEDTGILFAGDAAMNAVISLGKHTIWIDDAEQFGKSWDHMLKFAPKKIYPSHGNPFSPAYLVKYRHFMQGRTLIPM